MLFVRIDELWPRQSLAPTADKHRGFSSTKRPLSNASMRPSSLWSNSRPVFLLVPVVLMNTVICRSFISAKHFESRRLALGVKHYPGGVTCVLYSRHHARSLISADAFRFSSHSVQGPPWLPSGPIQAQHPKRATRKLVPLPKREE